MSIIGPLATSTGHKYRLSSNLTSLLRAFLIFCMQSNNRALRYKTPTRDFLLRAVPRIQGASERHTARSSSENLEDVYWSDKIDKINILMRDLCNVASRPMYSSSLKRSPYQVWWPNRANKPGLLADTCLQLEINSIQTCSV